MCIACIEQDTPQALHVWILHHAFHQPLPQANAPMRWQDDNITNPTDYRAIRDHTGKADLLIDLIYAKAEAILNRFSHDAHRSTNRPMGGGVKEVMDHAHIQSGFISADRIGVSLPLHGILFVYRCEIESNMESILEN